MDSIRTEETGLSQSISLRNSVRKKKEMRLPKRPLIGRIEVVHLDPYEYSTRGGLVLRIQYCTTARVLYSYGTTARGRTLGFRRLEDAVANACKD